MAPAPPARIHHPKGRDLAPTDDKPSTDAAANEVRFDDALIDEALRSELGPDLAPAQPPQPRLRLRPLPKVPRIITAATAGAVALLATVLTLNWNARRGALDDLSALPSTVRSTLAIAANASANDRSALWLVCTAENQLILALKTKLAVGREFYTVGQDGEAALYVEGLSNRIETRMRLVERARYDLLVSSKLSGTAIGAIAGFFGNAAPPTVSLVALETDTKLTGQVARGQIAGFAAACR